MEGGVIGGIVGGTLISGIIVWFARRWRARYTGGVERPVPYPLTIETQILYVSLILCFSTTTKYGMRIATDMIVYTPQDPSDPTTYPRTGELQLNDEHFGRLQQNHVRYSGLPEV